MNRQIGRMKSVPVEARAVQPRRPKFSRKPPCVIHFKGADWTTSLCGVPRKLGHLLVVGESDCPRCLEIRALAASEEAKPMVFCGICMDTGYSNWDVWDAAESAAEDARDCGRRSSIPAVEPMHCDVCPRCSECGVEVSRHTEEDREDMEPAGDGIPWVLPHCGKVEL